MTYDRGMDLVRRARAALVAVAALACAVALCAPRRTDVVLAPAPLALDASNALPAGLRLPIADTRSRMVTAVAADIDADGDLDVVATDGSLGLAVWLNDGTGQLTRKRPMSATGWRTDPPPAAVSNADALAPLSIPGSAPSLDVPASSVAIALEPARPVRAGPALAALSAIAPASPPRAPPALS